MIRARKLFTVVVPSLIAGGLLFGSTFGSADVTVKRDGQTIVIPTPPTAPLPPTPPPGADPWGPGSGHGNHRRHGMSVSIKDNKVQLDGVREMVAEQIANARKQIESNPGIPQSIRDRALAGLDRASASVDRHLAKLDRMKSLDMDQLGEELGQMGEELGRAMDSVGEDLSKLGDSISKDVQKQIAKSFKKMPKVVVTDDNDGNNSDDDNNNAKDSDNDSDNDNDSSAAAVASVDKDDADDRAAMAKLGDLQLEPQQRSMIQQIRRDTDRRVTDAKREIDQLSDSLKTALDNPTTNEAEVNRYVDDISRQEAVIRKARLNAWMSARRVLRDDQRVKVVHAASKKSP